MKSEANRRTVFIKGGGVEGGGVRLMSRADATGRKFRTCGGSAS